MKYKTCTEYWLDTETCTFRGEFDEMYKDIDDPWGCEEGCLSLNNRIFLEMLDERGPYGKILDIGCGLGGLTYQLAKKFSAAKVVGGDISETAIKKASCCYPDLKFRVINVLNDSFDFLGKFDLICISEVLWYVLDDLGGVLKRVGSALNQGGILGVHQYFPAKQKFGKDIVNGIDGFKTFVLNRTQFEIINCITSTCEDGQVLLMTLKFQC